MRDHHRQSHSSSIAGSRAPRDSYQVIYGINAVQEALRCGNRPFEMIWIAEGKDSHRLRAVRELAVARGTPVAMVSAARLTEEVGLASHQGVLAFVAPFPLLTLEQLLTAHFSQQCTAPLAILDGVKDPRNLGAIVRSAAAFGLGGIIIRARRAVGLTATVARAATGGLEYVPVAAVTNISQGIERLKREGFWIIGTDERAAVDCRTYQYTSPLALVFGEEGRGISPLVKRHCDALVHIPVRGPLRSLNVAVAAAVLFYEVTGRLNAQSSLPS